MSAAPDGEPPRSPDKRRAAPPSSPDRRRAAPPSAEIEAYLRRRIPLSAAMGVRIRSATASRVELAAPIAPNTNNGEMVFGGSAAAVALLAAWTLLYVREHARGGEAQLLIQRGAMTYERPITRDFRAVCELTDETSYRKFRATLERRGRARITLRSLLLQDGERAGHFEGDFVALASRRQAARAGS